MIDVPTIDALVTLVNAIAAGAALIIHAWGHTHPPNRSAAKDSQALPQPTAPPDGQSPQP